MNMRDRLREAQRLLFFATPSQDLSPRLEEEKDPDITRILILASERTATPSSALTPFLYKDPRLALAAARVLLRRQAHCEDAKTRLIESLTQGDLSEAMEALEAFADLGDPAVISAAKQRLAKNEDEFQRRIQQLGLPPAPQWAVTVGETSIGGYEAPLLSDAEHNDLPPAPPNGKPPSWRSPNWLFFPFLAALLLQSLPPLPLAQAHQPLAQAHQNREEKALLKLPNTASPSLLSGSPHPRRCPTKNA